MTAADTTKQHSRDLSAWWWIGVPVAMLAIALGAFAISPEAMMSIVRKDTDPGGGGIAEHGTVLVLLPGIAAGIVALVRARRELPLWVAGWLLAWVLASIYFAGEEASWGQHYLGWGTPDTLKTLNDQGETNIHNIGTWFDQKPRALVELWVIVAGLVLPLWRRARGPGGYAPSDWRHWVLPTHVGTVAAGLFVASLALNLAVKKLGWVNWVHLASNELREFYIATFLSTYLLSIWYRLRRPG